MKPHLLKLVFPSSILKKPFLLRWLYHIKYALQYPCKCCLVRMTCTESCIPLARFSFIFSEIIDAMDDRFEYIEKRGLFTNHKYLKVVEEWCHIIPYAMYAAVFIAYVTLLGVNFRKAVGVRSKKEMSLEEKRFDHLTTVYFLK